MHFPFFLLSRLLSFFLCCVIITKIPVGISLSFHLYRSPLCVCVVVCVCVELLCSPVSIDSFYPLLFFEYDVYPPKKTVLPLRLITFIYHPILLLLLLLLLYLLMMLIMEISNLNVLVYINEFYFYYF